MKGAHMQTKKSRLLKYLQTHKLGITGQDALLKLGLYRLSGEIHELRKEGRCYVKIERKQYCYHITVR